MVHPGGPSSQRRTSSGLVNASNTSPRGASKSRVTWISRSLGVDTLKLSGKCMKPPLPFPGRATLAFPFHGFQLAQQAVEADEGGLPVFAILHQPLGGFGEGPRLQLARSPLRIAAAGNQARAFEYLEMSRDRRLGHREGLDQLIHRRLPRGQARQDRPPRGVGQGGEGQVQATGRGWSITGLIHNEYVMQ